MHPAALRRRVAVFTGNRAEYGLQFPILRAIAAVVGDASGVPASQLLRDDDDRFRNLEQRLADRVVGHIEARTKIASVLRRSYAGFRGRKPLASFLLLGPLSGFVTLRCAHFT